MITSWAEFYNHVDQTAWAKNILEQARLQAERAKEAYDAACKNYDKYVAECAQEPLLEASCARLQSLIQVHEDDIKRLSKTVEHLDRLRTLRRNNAIRSREIEDGEY